MEQKLTLSGAPAVISGRDDDPYMHRLAAHAREMRRLEMVLTAALPRDGVALDIGANIGLTTVALSRQAGEVVALEPSPANFACLERNLRHNDASNVRARQLAAGTGPGTISFHESAYGAGSSQVDERHMALAETATIGVPVTSVDRLVEEEALSRLDFVKIDVEGFEIDVLRGMENTIRRLRPTVFLEFNSWCMIAFRNLNPREMADVILDQFDHVFWVGDTQPVRIEGIAGKLSFLHENLVQHQCMTDVIATSDASVAARIEALRFRPRRSPLRVAAGKAIWHARRLLDR
jgi:FkbM family methyltransferase